MSGTTSHPALHISSRQPGKSLRLFFILRTPCAKKIKADSGKKCSRYEINEARSDIIRGQDFSSRGDPSDSENSEDERLRWRENEKRAAIITALCESDRLLAQSYLSARKARREFCGGNIRKRISGVRFLTILCILDYPAVSFVDIHGLLRTDLSIRAF